MVKQLLWKKDIVEICSLFWEAFVLTPPPPQKKKHMMLHIKQIFTSEYGKTLKIESGFLFWFALKKKKMMGKNKKEKIISDEDDADQ